MENPNPENINNPRENPQPNPEDAAWKEAGERMEAQGAANGKKATDTKSATEPGEPGKSQEAEKPKYTPDPKSRDLYKRFGIERNATAEEIHKAYRAATKLLHPIVNGGNDTDMVALNVAKDILLNSNERTKYDLKNREAGRYSEPQQPRRPEAKPAEQVPPPPTPPGSPARHSQPEEVHPAERPAETPQPQPEPQPERRDEQREAERTVFAATVAAEARAAEDPVAGSAGARGFGEYFRAAVGVGLVGIGIASEAREAIFSGGSGDSAEAPKKSGEYGMVALGIATLGFAIISKMLKGLYFFTKTAIIKKGNIGWEGGMAAAEKAFSDKEKKN